MRIAFILPSLENRGPVIIAKYIIEGIIKKCDIDVYYFDNIVDLDFPCECRRIGFFELIDFSKYDIVHSHQIRPDLYLWFHKKKISSCCKIISTVHQDIFKVLEHSYNKLIALVAGKFWITILKSFDVVVSLTNIMKNQLNGIKNVQVVYNGIPALNDNLNIENEDLILIEELSSKYTILGVSALLGKVKGIKQIINVMPNLNGYALIIIGDGEEKNTLEKLASDLGVSNRCLFLGFRHKGYRYFNYFDIYMLTSYSEGFPICSIEAAQYGLPMVCSKIPVLEEIYRIDEVCFFELDNTSSLIGAIKQAASNNKMLSVKIKEKYENSLKAEIMANNYFELYKKVKNENRNNRR